MYAQVQSFLIPSSVQLGFGATACSRPSTRLLCLAQGSVKHRVVFEIRERVSRPLLATHGVQGFIFVTVDNLLVIRCNVCSADGGFHGPGRDGTAVVEERLLGQCDRVAQLLLDGGLRGAQRGLQVGGIAIVAMTSV